MFSVVSAVFGFWVGWFQDAQQLLTVVRSVVPYVDQGDESLLLREVSLLQFFEPCSHCVREAWVSGEPSLLFVLG